MNKHEQTEVRLIIKKPVTKEIDKFECTKRQIQSERFMYARDWTLAEKLMKVKVTRKRNEHVAMQKVKFFISVEWKTEKSMVEKKQ